MSPSRLRHDDTVNVQEVREPGSEPLVVDAVVRRTRGEGQEERGDALAVNDNLVIRGMNVEMPELLFGKRTKEVNRLRIQRQDLREVLAACGYGSHAARLPSHAEMLTQARLT